MKQISFHDDVLPIKNRLFRLALRITLNREEAEDIVQETLIKVWNSRSSWHDINSIEAFSLTVCRNLALDYQRKKQRNIIDKDAEIEEGRADNAPSPYEVAQQNDSLTMINSIINELPEQQKTCLQLRDIEGKSYKEIADLLAISDEQVKVNIYRARQKLKERIQTINQYGL